jgi:hypothetical protein
MTGWPARHAGAEAGPDSLRADASTVRPALPSVVNVFFDSGPGRVSSKQQHYWQKLVNPGVATQ